MEIEDASREAVLDNDTDSGVSTPVDRNGNDAQGKPEVEPAQESSMSMSFRINVVDAQVILIANPTISTRKLLYLEQSKSSYLNKMLLRFRSPKLACSYAAWTNSKQVDYEYSMTFL